MVLDMETMRAQHAAAEEMAASLMAIVDSYRGQCDAVPIAQMVGKLNALLRAHLAYERRPVSTFVIRAEEPTVTMGSAHDRDYAFCRPARLVGTR